MLFSFGLNWAAQALMAESEGQGLAAVPLCLGSGPYEAAGPGKELVGWQKELVQGAGCRLGFRAEASRALARFFGAMGE